ncbi:D-alanyl-D-alanine carboxypeptidase family protein [Bordetella flabilis]|uniref:D-alanyl-D-alanine carboxypeptidase family protein n=1 Tax=Bordetella flabilis TaxID=463014 RepID=UPI000A006F67|nr:D-alanyl-D-alanine carboxypeptidase family protein [Bordetella flabilis]
MYKKTVAVSLALIGACAVGAALAAAPSAAPQPPVVPQAGTAPSAALPPSPQAPGLDAKSWLLLDATSGQVIASQNADERVEPASLTKIMTAYLVFQALKNKTLQLDQTVTVSVHAWKVAPGSSKMFIEPGQHVSIDDLLSGLLIQSGNDAAVALAEATAGSEDAFVQRMNETAARMGLKSTHFASPHGLPDPQTYSTARDLAALSARLIRDFPDLYVRYDHVKQFRFNNITQPNRNRLLWIDPTVDGGKTGHTEAAGYCMIASALRPGAAGQRRLIAVVMGTSSDKARTAATGMLLNWGFQNYETVKLYAKGDTVGTATVWKGEQSQVQVGFDRDIYATIPRAWVPRLQKVITRQGPLVAPLAADTQVGTADMQVDGHSIVSYPVVALQPVAQAGVLGRGWDSMRLWVYGLMNEKPPA